MIVLWCWSIYRWWRLPGEPTFPCAWVDPSPLVPYFIRERERESRRQKMLFDEFPLFVSNFIPIPVGRRKVRQDAASTHYQTFSLSNFHCSRQPALARCGRRRSNGIWDQNVKVSSISSIPKLDPLPSTFLHFIPAWSLGQWRREPIRDRKNSFQKG